MQNFIYSIPTTVYFGKGKICHLPAILTAFHSPVLLVYGCGHIRDNGIYDEVVSRLRDNTLSFQELSGISPNPDIQFVYKGADLCKRHNIGVILAIGGGSVIDCAKMISAGASTNRDPWELVQNPQYIEDALPVVAIPTAAGSGSEMDYTSVISNEKTKEKIAVANHALLPYAAIMDPTYTFSVNPIQTAAGIADIMTHALEIYLSKEDACFQEHMTEAVLTTCIECGAIVMDHPDHYNARASLMWSATWAMNGFLRWGMPVGWTLHPIAHELSALYGLSHGVGLAILLPHYLEHILSAQTAKKISRCANRVWNIKSDSKYRDASTFIKKMKEFFTYMGLPDTLSKVGIDDQKFDQVSERAIKNLGNTFCDISRDDIKQILRKAL